MSDTTIAGGRVEPGASAGLSWSAIVLGAMAGTALSFILLSFGAAIGLAVSSTAPTWRDTSVALSLLSGLYIILQAIASFALAGYVAGRLRRPFAASAADQVGYSDGMNGLGAWALAVVLGAILAGIAGNALLNRTQAGAPPAQVSAAEPLLSYELDRLFRAPRRGPAADLTSERAEAGRILLTSSSHRGVLAEDRNYLVSLVGAVGGADAERRVDTAIVNAKSAIARSRATSIILAFSLASALLIGAFIAWTTAAIGGRHRDGEVIPDWLNWNQPHHRRV